MRVFVTRPAREAQRWVEALLLRGIAATPLPLIEIGPAPDDHAVLLAWEQLEGQGAVMFVSANAVDGFFSQPPAGVRQWPGGLTSTSTSTNTARTPVMTRAWAPGPGTREALLRAGVPTEAIDSPAQDAEQFDSQTLWEQVSDQLLAGQRVLVVRGGAAADPDSGPGPGRDWLAAQLAGRGVDVQTVVTYTRSPPAWTQAQLDAAQQGSHDGSLWLFSSSQAIAHLRSLLPDQPWRQARAIATHPRIAQSARAAGFGVVCLSRPTLADVAASIESIG